MKRQERVGMSDTIIGLLAALAAALPGGCGGSSGAGNSVPLANAGPDQYVVTGSVVTLDGSASSDANGDPLTYRWELTSRPAGSGATLSTATAVRPTIAVDVNGVYVATLVVNDGRDDSAADTVTITASTSPGNGETVVTISSGSGDATLQALAMDASGAAVAVWVQDNVVRSNRYVPGTGWGTATLVSTGTGRADAPGVAMDGNGNAMAVWRQWDGTQYSVYANRFEPGTGWGTATLIEDGAGQAGGLDEYSVPGGSPQVAMDAVGNALAVWQQWDGAQYSIYANRYETGTGWGKEALIESGADRAYAPKLAMSPNGSAIAVWRYWRFPSSDSSGSICANRYEPGAGWGTETRIDAASGNAFNPEAVMDSGGNAVVAWEQYISGHARSGIYTRRFETQTGWGTTSILVEVWGSAFLGLPRLATDGPEIAVVWHQGTQTGLYPWDSTSEIKVSRFAPGTGWTTPGNLSPAGWYADSQEVAMGRGGNTVAVWRRRDDHTIFANRYSAGMGWETPNAVETANGEAYLPHVATDGNGNFIVVWQQREGTHFVISAARIQVPLIST